MPTAHARPAVDMAPEQAWEGVPLTVYGPENVSVCDAAVCAALTVPMQGYDEHGLVESPVTVATTTPEPLPATSVMPLARAPAPTAEMVSTVPVIVPVAVTEPIAVTVVLGIPHAPLKLKRENRAMGPVGVPDTVS